LSGHGFSFSFSSLFFFCLVGFFHSLRVCLSLVGVRVKASAIARMCISKKQAADHGKLQPRIHQVIQYSPVSHRPVRWRLGGTYDVAGKPERRLLLSPLILSTVACLSPASSSLPLTSSGVGAG
jgi:hypothetical protein